MGPFFVSFFVNRKKNQVAEKFQKQQTLQNRMELNDSLQQYSTWK